MSDMGLSTPEIFNIEIERAVLCALLQSPDQILEISDFLDPDHFASRQAAEIYRALVAEMSAKGFASATTILPALDPQAFVDESPKEVLVDLLSGFGLPSQTRHYAEQIRDLWRRRQIVAAAREIIGDAQVIDAERSAADCIEDAEARLYEIVQGQQAESGYVPIREGIRKALERSAAAFEGIETGIKTGIHALDAKIGGLEPGNLYILGGRASMGKTALAITIGINVAKAGKTVLMNSLEMDDEGLTRRPLARETGITAKQQIQRPSADDVKHLIQAGQELQNLSFAIDETPALTVHQIRTRFRRHQRKHGADFLIVDHLALIKSDSKSQNRTYQLEEITGTLKAIAKEFKVPVLLLAQVNRGVENREDKRPTLADLKDSGAIEQDADVVMFVYRHFYYLERDEPRRQAGEKNDAFYGRQHDWSTQLDAEKDKAEVIIAKSRNDETGTIRLGFDGRRQWFYDLTEGQR
ncbi:DnaB-like helicase C-terminal domain-containing protein [Caballeronia sp. TF1N1]|uniref:replicative DNA helicase n=1 Tax=Caballeronia sp. TF1N1 TaxID=2878153 RepID=UPI001FD081CE|nr:DnaB-like helicase C-terminal domain-containing protein [Caballeronia sp. TF1N1]